MWYASCHVVVPAGDPDGATRSNSGGAGHRDRVFFAHVAQRLGFEARLVGRAFVAQCRAAVHLQQQPGLVEQIEIATHRHVADSQKRCQFADSYGAASAHFGDDDFVTLTGQHPRRDRVDWALDHDR